MAANPKVQSAPKVPNGGSHQKFGTLPVFLTSICTILGAILFLRFGWAVGNVGLLGTISIVIIGHLVTIPTALAIAEIATNQRVEGGGAYYIISRSFGLNIGGAIGIALYLSQAISVAFYVIAFAASFEPIFAAFDVSPNLRFVSIPTMVALSALVLTRGANSGMNLLYGVAAILAVSLVMFFIGKTDYSPGSLQEVLTRSFNARDFDLDFVREKGLPESPIPFFYVFTIIFPAFTGIIAGLGLSGDLKDPAKSIPSGTLAATVVGMVVYIAVAIKLAFSLPPEVMADKNQLVMSDVAIWGPIIPIGLAAATISSALGSILVAPRTLQALGADKVIPGKGSDWMAELREKDQEPINAGWITVGIAFIFVVIGDVDFVAEIISMFFMVTYGTICLISFLEHFAGNPAYRPSFTSRWYLSLPGALLCIWLMFQMKALYAFLSIFTMLGFYLWVSRSRDSKGGMTRIFQGVILQTSRSLRVLLQKKVDEEADEKAWTPSAICISRYSFERLAAFDMLRFISHKYGFGTYIHLLEGYYSKATVNESHHILKRLLTRTKVSKSNVYIDTIISPSYTTSVAQMLQLPGISGQDNNMVLFEFSRHDTEPLNDVVDNYGLVRAANFDICILRSSEQGFGYKNEIHIWLTQEDFENGNLMILLGYIILGHPEWKGGVIKIFAIYPAAQLETQKKKLLSLIASGRLAISPNNIQFIARKEEISLKNAINNTSADADLTIIGFRPEAVKKTGKEIFFGYEELGNILFVSSETEKQIA
ncbi:MAG: amino acid permease [Bacteroidota bacterium]